MPPLIELAVPLEPSSIKPVSEDGVHRARRYRRAALAIYQTCGARFAGDILERILASRIPFEYLGDDGRHIWIDGDHFFAVLAGDVAIAQRRFGRPDALLGLLLHSLTRLLRQIVDVVLRHQHLDAVHELFGGAGIPR